MSGRSAVDDNGGGIGYLTDLLLHMAPGLYQWCMLAEFSIVTAELDDRCVLDAVINHRRYRDHCAGPLATQGYHELHGPYRLQTISVDGFSPSTRSDAIGLLEWWPATDLCPQYADSLMLCREILGAWVFPILARASSIYRLVLPREGNEHDWGWVVGNCGFHEFLAIDRRSSRATLIIATDD